MLEVQHVELDPEAFEGSGRNDAQQPPRRIEHDLGRRRQEMALDRCVDRITPLKQTDRKQKLVSFFGLFEAAAHEVHVLVDVLDLLPPAHLLRPRLPSIDEIFEPRLLDLGVVFQAAQFGASFGRIAEIEKILFDFDEHGDLREEVRFSLRLVQFFGIHPVRDDFRHSRPHRHAFLAHFKPQLTEIFRALDQEGRSTFGVPRRHIAEPDDSVSVCIRAEPPSPERGGCLEEGQKISVLVRCRLVHSFVYGSIASRMETLQFQLGRRRVDCSRHVAKCYMGEPASMHCVAGKTVHCCIMFAEYPCRGVNASLPMSLTSFQCINMMPVCVPHSPSTTISRPGSKSDGARTGSR